MDGVYTDGINLSRPKGGRPKSRSGFQIGKIREKILWASFGTFSEASHCFRWQKELHDGCNPLEQRRAQRQAAKLEACHALRSSNAQKPISLKPPKHGKTRNTPHSGFPLSRLMRTPFLKG